MTKSHNKQIVFLSYGDLLIESGYKTRLLGELELAASLKEYQIFLFSFEKKSSYRQHQSQLSALHQELKKRGVRLFLWPRSSWYWPNLWQMFFTLKKIKFHRGLIHAQSVYATIIALIIKKIFPAKVIFDAHGLLVPEVRQSQFFSLQKIIAAPLENQCLASADYIITASFSLSDYFQKNQHLPSRQITPLPCLTKASSSKPLSSSAQKNLRRRLGLPSDQIIGVYLGGGQAWQPLAPVVSFVAQTKIHLLVITSEPEKISPQLHHLSSRQYTIINLPHAQVPQHLLAADLAFLFRPDSLVNHIAFPTKFAEYLMAGLPIVHNGQVSDLKKIISDHNLGWELPLSFSASQSNNIIQNFRRHRQQYQQNCRQYALSHLTWPVYRPTLQTIYRKLFNPKILYVVTSDFYGGAQKYVLDLASYFQQHNCLVDVAFGTNSTNNLFVQKLRAAQINYFSLWYLRRAINPFLDILAIFFLRSLFITRDYDIIHLNSSMSGFLGRLAAFGLKKKIFYTAHGWVFNEMLSAPWRWFYLQLEKLAVPLSTRIFCLSKLDYSQVKKYHLGPSHRFRLLPNSLDLKKTSRLAIQPISPSANNFFKHLTVWKQKKYYIVGTIANFFPAKNLFQLIPIAQQLNRLTKNRVRYVIVGFGPQQNRFQQLLRYHHLESLFLLTGQQANPLPWLAKFAVFVLPSTKEGFPFALLEAGVLGIPIVASPVGGVVDLIIDQKTGLLADPSDPAQFAAQIFSLLQNKSLSTSLANHLFQEIQAKYNQKNIFPQYHREYFSN